MQAYPAKIFREPAAGVAFVFPILILAGNKLLAGALVALAVAAIVWRRPIDWRPLLPFAATLALLAVWGVASALWSVSPGLSLERAARFSGIVLCGLIACGAAGIRETAGRETVAAGLRFGLVVTAALSLGGLAWEGFAGTSPLSWLNQKPFATIAAVLLFPVVGGLLQTGRRLVAALIAGALVAQFIWSDSLAALVAAGIGAAAFVLVLLGGRRGGYAVSAAVVVGIVVLPVLAAWSDSSSRLQAHGVQLRQSAAHRIVVWDFAGKRIAERPLLGWGLGGARWVPGADRNPLEEPRYRGLLRSSGIPPQAELRTLPLHPHNAVLHALLELGVPALLLYLGLCVMSFRLSLRTMSGRCALATRVSTVTTAIAIGQVSFSLWQTWWIAAQFTFAAILLALYRSET